MAKESKLEKTIEEIAKELSEKEKRHDALLQKTRFFVRDCARAIKHLHMQNTKEARAVASRLEKEVKELQELGEGLEHVYRIALQEYVEIKCLLALLEKKELPSHKELGVPTVPYLNGLADCVGELRRALQIALRKGKKKEAEYFFEKMSELYDELMTLKFSSSLVGQLRRKTDVLRHQIEQARSELLR